MTKKLESLKEEYTRLEGIISEAEDAESRQNEIIYEISQELQRIYAHRIITLSWESNGIQITATGPISEFIDWNDASYDVAVYGADYYEAMRRYIYPPAYITTNVNYKIDFK